MANNYCLNPLTNCEYRTANTGKCIASMDCGYKACFWGVSKETDLLLRNMCAIQIQNKRILELLQKQKQK